MKNYSITPKSLIGVKRQINYNTNSNSNAFAVQLLQISNKITAVFLEFA